MGPAQFDEKCSPLTYDLTNARHKTRLHEKISSYILTFDENSLTHCYRVSRLALYYEAEYRDNFL